jgi:hypothetical protein
VVHPHRLHKEGLDSLKHFDYSRELQKVQRVTGQKLGRFVSPAERTGSKSGCSAPVGVFTGKQAEFPPRYRVVTPIFGQDFLINSHLSD